MRKYFKLVPALCMLLISAVLLGTSTFAWFSMNTRVSVDNIQITAKVDSVFLQIENIDGESSNDVKTQADAVTPAARIKPADYISISSSGQVTWGKAHSDDPGDEKYTAKNNLFAIPNAQVGEYVWIDQFHIFVAENADNAVGENLVINSVTIDDSGNAIDMKESIRVLVVGPDGAMIWANDGATENGSVVQSLSVIDYKSTSTTCLANEVDNTGIYIHVYAYFCGNDESVTTNNAQSLGQLQISIQFSVD